MDSFMLALSVVGPLLVYMIVGALIRRANIFSVTQFKALNSMIFKILIPLSLFFNLYTADIKSAINIQVFVLCGAGVIFLCIFCYLTLRSVIPDRKDAVTLAQGIFRSNFVLFGMTIAKSLCDDQGVALVSALSAVVVPIFNISTVILFEINRGGQVKPRRLLFNIAKNPMVIGSILGCFFSLCHIPIPEMIASPLKNLGNAATPLALVTLGGILSFESMKSHKSYLIIGCAGRLLAVPILFLSIAVLTGLRGNTLAAVLAVFASPTAVASSPMAQEMGGNGELAGEIVVTTTVLCLLTLFVYIFCLSTWGMLGSY